MPLQDFYNKIVVLQEFDIVDETIKIIDENSKYLADLLATQLASGRDGKGDLVTIFGRDFYSDRTVFNKERFGSGLGKITDRITNYMSGSFYREMFVRTQGTNFFIESRVPYYESILKQSGNTIMELNEENLRSFTENILVPQLQNKFSSLWNGI